MTGEALPPHFQFTMYKKTDELKKLHMETLVYLQDMHGKFGSPEVKRWLTTFGLNVKGGMDDEEF